MSKKKQLGKPLTRSILLDLGRPEKVKAIGFDGFGRIVAMGDDGRLITAKQATIESGFDRENPSKSRKTVSQAIVDGPDAYHHIDLYLLKFQRHLFVDTNTRLVDGETISVTAVVGAYRSIARSSGRQVMDLKHEISFEFRDAGDVAEQIGWVYAVRGFQLGRLKGQPGSVAVVVDHQLGDLGAFNRREKLIAGIMHLPPEFTLVYASSERGKNQFVNRAMNRTDWIAGRMLDMAINARSNRECLIAGEAGEPFAFRRAWQPTEYEVFDVSRSRA